MKIYYDTEFLERGYKYSIDLISIGMVREDGKELYLISADAPLMYIEQHDWLMENVVPHLPIQTIDGDIYWDWDAHVDSERITPRHRIAQMVKEFVLEHPKPELWAWYGAYDHVCIAQLFNTMSELPEGFPMFTHDLRQVVDVRLPGKTGDEHHALADARWLKTAYEFWRARSNDVIIEDQL